MTNPVEFDLRLSDSPPRIEARMVLACCGVVFHRVVSTMPPADAADMGSVLTYWMREREARHRCDLVWEENPMGLFDKYAHLLPKGAPPRYKPKPNSI